MLESRLPSRAEVMEWVASVSALYTRACSLRIQTNAGTTHPAALDDSLARVGQVIEDARDVLNAIVQRASLAGFEVQEAATDLGFQGEDGSASGMLPTPAMLAWRAIAEGSTRGLVVLRSHAVVPQVRGDAALARAERARRDVCAVLSGLLDALVDTRGSFAPLSASDGASAARTVASAQPKRHRHAG